MRNKQRKRKRGIKGKKERKKEATQIETSRVEVAETYEEPSELEIECKLPAR